MIGSGTTSLLGRIRAGGGQDDWKAMVARCWRVIFGYARHHGLSETDAEDFAQELLVELTRVLPEFDYNKEYGTFRAYLRTITSRRLIDRLRATRPELIPSLTHEPRNDEIERWWEKEWRQAMLRQCLDETSTSVEPKTFQVFQLLVINGMPPKEVASFHDISIDSVYQAKARVTKHARMVFERLQQEEDDHG